MSEEQVAEAIAELAVFEEMAQALVETAGELGAAAADLGEAISALTPGPSPVVCTGEGG